MRTLRSAASVAASLALLIGVPWMLSATIGNPLDRVPDLLAGDVNDHVVLAALAAADVTGDITVTGSTVTVTAAPPSRPRSWPSSASTRSAAPPPPPRSRCTAPPPERLDMTDVPTPPATDRGES